MNTAAIRDRLYYYIRVADDKKIKAIYMMLEDDIAEETEWWNNPAFVSELEKEYEAWDSGKDKGYSLADIKVEIVSRKKISAISSVFHTSRDPKKKYTEGK
jgi:hypothetical protein